MKKFYFMLLAFAGTFAMAQVTFNPGIRAGANFAHLSDLNNSATYYYDSNGTYVESNPEFKTIVDAYVGFQANIRFTKVYALQPEINYSRQGSEVRDNNSNTITTLRTGYVGMQLVNKFYMNNFNLHVGPMIDFLVSNNIPQSNQYNGYTDSVTPIDLGIVLGAGYDFTPNFGAEVRLKKGIIPVDFFDGNNTNVVFQTGVYFTFPIK